SKASERKLPIEQRREKKYVHVRDVRRQVGLDQGEVHRQDDNVGEGGDDAEDDGVPYLEGE
ncbi:uncharacterized, partial [Tachysurus ichikawai]